MTEAQLHRAVADYMRFALPASAWWTTIANESPAGRGWQGKLKGRGVRAGTPDILVVYAGKVIFIELKSENGRVTQVQRGCHIDIRAAGGSVHVARSIEQVEAVLSLSGVPLQGRLVA